MKRLLAVLFSMLLSVSVAYGYYRDIATDKESYTLGITWTPE